MTLATIMEPGAGARLISESVPISANGLGRGAPGLQNVHMPRRARRRGLKTEDVLKRMGLPSRDLADLPSSAKRFPDGAQYRIEIPSVESPEQLRRVVERAEEYSIPLHRVSQGSGVVLLTDREVEQMAEIGRSERIEVSLFTGPRASYDIGATSKSANAAAVSWRLRGVDQLKDAVEDIERGIRLGIRSFLVADEGLLWVLQEMKKEGEIPKDVVWKISVTTGHGNAASARLLERLGAGTLNVMTDLSLPQLAAIRAAIRIPLDVYISVPTGYGGFVRHYEVPEMVRVASPIYLKFSIPLGQNVYPAGRHLLPTMLGYADEEVRQARLSYEHLQRRYPSAVTSERGARGLAVPT